MGPLGGFGKILPRRGNRVSLDRTRNDRHGLPLLAIDAETGESERANATDMAAEVAAMLEAAGFKNVLTYERERRGKAHTRGRYVVA